LIPTKERKSDRWDSFDREAGDGMTVEEINAICEEALNEPLPEPDPLREDIDWIRTEDGEVRHPLQHRCYQSAFRFLQIEEARQEMFAIREEIIRLMDRLRGRR
jgi:hypothetical protein